MTSPTSPKARAVAKQASRNITHVDPYETAARDNIHQESMKTTYLDTVGKLVKEKTAIEHLNITTGMTTNHRGKKPPEGLHYSNLKWDEGRQDWIRSPNSKLNFVRDTWGSQWDIEHTGAKPTPEERFAPSSANIGAAYHHGPPGQPDTLAQGPPLSPRSALQASSQGEERVSHGRRSASAHKPHRHGRSEKVALSWPPPGPPPVEAAYEVPHKWSGVPTDKLLLDANPNVYGRWYRTHSAIPMRDIPQALERETRFVTTKDLETATINGLMKGYPEVAWAASAHANWPETHLHKTTMISGEAPLWMKVQGVRKALPERSKTVETAVRTLRSRG